MIRIPFSTLVSIIGSKFASVSTLTNVVFACSKTTSIEADTFMPVKGSVIVLTSVLVWPLPLVPMPQLSLERQEFNDSAIIVATIKFVMIVITFTMIAICF